MKKMRIIMIPVMVLSVTLLFFSCGKKGAHKHEHGAESAIEKYWTCPMHPQVHSEEPGKCPLCGMDLVQVEKMKEEKVTSGNGDPWALFSASAAAFWEAS